MVELAQEDKDFLDKILNGVKKILTNHITPEGIESNIRSINTVNTGGDKQKLSNEQFMRYITTAIKNHPPGEYIDRIKDGIEETCGVIAAHTHLPKTEDIIALKEHLNSYVEGQLIGVNMARNIAESSDKPNHKDEMKSLIAQYANITTKIVEDSIKVPPEYQDAAAKFIRPKAQKIGQEIVRDLESISTRPDIKAALLNFPKMPEASNLTADYMCSQFPGFYTKPKGQTKEAHK